MMAFAVRSAVLLALSSSGQAHIVEGDESGAFDTVIRSDMDGLSKVWTGQCDFGTWASQIYKRQVVRLLTSSGLAPPVHLEVGMSQGCCFAPTRYNLIGAPPTGVTSLCVDSGLTVSMHEFVFSDDRRWISCSKEAIEENVGVANAIANEACVVANLSKLVYVLLELKGEICPCKDLLWVGGHIVSSAIQVPGVVGLSVQPGAVLPSLFVICMKKIRTLKVFLSRYHSSFLLSIHCIFAYVIPVLVFSARGSCLPRGFLSKVQPPLNSLYRPILSLPADTPLSFIILPTSCFGWGFPNLTV